MAKINTTNYQPVTAWNGTQDLLIVEQLDGTKVATPAQLKQFMEAGDFEATGEVKDGHGNMLKDMAKSADIENIKVANVSATMSVLTADARAVGGYRSVSNTSKVLSTFTGYPKGKTIVAENLYAYGENAACLGVVNVINGVVYLNTAASGDYNVYGHVFYKD